MKEQKVIAVEWCAPPYSRGKIEVKEIEGLVPSGWRIVMISSMGGGGESAGYAALVVIEKDE